MRWTLVFTDSVWTRLYVWQKFCLDHSYFQSLHMQISEVNQNKWKSSMDLQLYLIEANRSQFVFNITQKKVNIWLPFCCPLLSNAIEKQSNDWLLSIDSNWFVWKSKFDWVWLITSGKNEPNSNFSSNPCRKLGATSITNLPPITGKDR